MSTFILVHGGDCSTASWNRLAKNAVHTENGRMGNLVWNEIVDILRAAGHNVYYPTLINEFETNLSGHIEQVCSIIKDNHLQDVILAGHSYGGMIITGVAELLPDKIATMVFFDASIPKSGQSLYDVIQDASHDPAMIRGLEPAPAYIEKLYFTPEKQTNIPKIYVHCAQSEVSPVIAHVLNTTVRIKDNWKITKIDCGHIFQATHSKEAAAILLQASN